MDYVSSFLPIAIITLICLKGLSRLYEKFQKGDIKIKYGKYSFRRIKYKPQNKYILEMRKVAKNAVNCVPNNPFFEGKNLDNKICMIVYDGDKPIGLNVMFDYICNNKRCLHIGLVLVDKQYQGTGVQKYSPYNIIFYVLENIFEDTYITDIGSSATGMKLFNKGVKNSYPNIYDNTKCIPEYVEISKFFFNNFKEDVQISNSATLDEFIVRGSNKPDGGAEYLLKFPDSRKSKDEKANLFMSKLDKYDDIISVGIINFRAFLKY